MKQVLFFILSLLWSVPAAAQHLELRAGGGLATHYGEAQNVGAYKIGVGYEWELSQKFTVTPAVEFQGKGWKNPNELVSVLDENGQPVIDEETQEPVMSMMSRSATALYVAVPVMLNYYLRTGSSRYVVLSAGPYVAVGVGGKQKTKGDGTAEGAKKYFYEDNTFDEPGTKRFDAGINTFVGYQFASGLTIGIEGQWGLAKFDDAGQRNLAGFAALRYAF